MREKRKNIHTQEGKKRKEDKRVLEDSWRTMVSNDIKVQWNACPLLVSSFFLSFFLSFMYLCWTAHLCPVPLVLTLHLTQCPLVNNRSRNARAIFIFFSSSPDAICVCIYNIIAPQLSQPASQESFVFILFYLFLLYSSTYSIYKLCFHPNCNCSV
jgi:hypothetical protein